MSNQDTIFNRYPVLIFLFPIVGGYLAWEFSGSIELGLLLLIAGTLTNGYFYFKRKKERQKNP